MNNQAALAIEAIARRVVDAPSHYVQAVSEMAGHHDVRASRDIISANGIKLIARGARVDASLQRKLAGHRLAGLTLEESLLIADGVTPGTLAADTARLIDSDPWYQRLADRSGDPNALRHGVSRLTLPREILFRLTVARDQRHALYHHLVGVGLICHYLALRAGLTPAQIDAITVAGLCHDLGELHTDPAVLASGHRVSEEELRFVYVHPITGWLIMRDLVGVAPKTNRAILQHHERLDGSGYPYGRADGQIGIGGRILAAADVSEAIMARFRDHRRLSTLLRLNKRKYDEKIVNLLHDTMPAETAASARFERATLLRQLRAVALVLEGLGAVRALPALVQSEPGVFLNERIFNLRTVVLQFGFDPDSLEMPLQLAEEDATIAAELTAALDELQFQFGELGREFDRRAPDWLAVLDPNSSAVLTEWRRKLADCIAG
ncbi:HD-GYP domain-containing protein [Azoarcus sp. KH32C]|uniref:HD-GYP domain-containing protein n=1 Tax=Azoarcus sp. KH32C TaxID=748247 RepID=UPI0002386D20|nr:HD domain-containing phosphohydrolase [Azoarcus sp. KH32C]BAL22775.1 metal dependent phosphohydrolase [Azoarcus sp. KH32C]